MVKYINTDNFKNTMRSDKAKGLLFMLVFALCFLLTVSIASGMEYVESKIETNLQFTCTVNYQIPTNSATYNFSIFYPNATANRLSIT